MWLQAKAVNCCKIPITLIDPLGVRFRAEEPSKRVMACLQQLITAVEKFCGRIELCRSVGNSTRYCNFAYSVLASGSARWSVRSLARILRLRNWQVHEGHAVGSVSK